jgi:hypothetical protein
MYPYRTTDAVIRTRLLLESGARQRDVRESSDQLLVAMGEAKRTVVRIDESVKYRKDILTTESYITRNGQSEREREKARAEWRCGQVPPQPRSL